MRHKRPIFNWLQRDVYMYMYYIPIRTYVYIPGAQAWVTSLLSVEVLGHYFPHFWGPGKARLV